MTMPLRYDSLSGLLSAWHLGAQGKAAGTNWSMLLPCRKSPAGSSITARMQRPLVQAALQKGNPCLHSSITAFKRAYEQQMWALGYGECSAVSLTFEKYSQVLRQLDAEAAALRLFLAADRPTKQVALLLLQRDQLALSLQWSSAMRGMNIGRLTLSDVQDPRGQSLEPGLRQAAFPYAAGYQWQLAPNGTKPRQQRRAGVLPMTVLPGSEAYRDPLRLLHQFVQVGPAHRGPADAPLHWC